jgi:hypothetical protein
MGCINSTSANNGRDGAVILSCMVKHPSKIVLAANGLPSDPIADTIRTNSAKL